MSTKHALIVDDEPDLCELAEITLSRMGLNTSSANDIATAKKLLSTKTFDLCLTDMNLPDGNGIELVNYIQENAPKTPVAVITAYGNMESAIRALKAGAFDFVAKPVDLQILRRLVESAIKLSTPSLSGSETQAETPSLLGESRQIEKLRTQISKLARSQAPVFIYGESGSGKELAARMIHEQGARADKPFIPINCGAIPSELMESEFFGHKKGSFTGATADKEGLFKAADGGTLFLDEVAELPLHMQVKLLRAIQEKSIRPLGEHQEQAVDVRILSASHKDLAALVKQGKFRQDLYYRINVIELTIPGLRQRTSDIPLLSRHILGKLTRKMTLEKTPQISDAALQTLMHYDFPGNVRELENILERAIALTENDIIQPEDLQLGTTPTPTSIADTLETNPKMDQLSLSKQEKDTIMEALEQVRWNKTAAARLLGITLRQLRYRMEKLGIE